MNVNYKSMENKIFEFKFEFCLSFCVRVSVCCLIFCYYVLPGPVCGFCIIPVPTVCCATCIAWHLYCNVLSGIKKEEKKRKTHERREEESSSLPSTPSDIWPLFPQHQILVFFFFRILSSFSFLKTLMTLSVHARLFRCVHNPLNFDTDHRIFNVRLWAFFQAYTHGGPRFILSSEGRL